VDKKLTVSNPEIKRHFTRLDANNWPDSMLKMHPHKPNFYGHALACILMVFLVSCSRHTPKTQTFTINNVNPRLDVDGQSIDAHGGCMQFFNGRFYLYGNAFGTNHDDKLFNCPFAVYSSPNMVDWKLEGTLLKDAPKGVYYRPYVVFNPGTQKYVLWYNWYQTLWKGQAGVAESDSPVGPFIVATPKAHLSGSSPGDGSLFVDNDGTGYYVYTDIANDYALRVERLTTNYLDSSGVMSGFVGYGVEAPILFRRNDFYYILCGPLCSDCPQGSSVSVEMGYSPLGPFQVIGEINDYSPSNNMQAKEYTVPPADQTNSDGFVHPPKARPFIRGQETWVSRLPTAGMPQFIWMADGWKSAKDGMRGHDFQYWSAPLKFNPDGTIQPLKFSASWSLTWKQAQ
jgi:Glycosyl hydrolases family 43